MKSSLKAKLIQHFAAKKGNAGFTLIELLVVIIIIGILSAIALPSFLNQANKAKQSEAKTYVGSMNRAQQAFYLEKNAFVDGIAANNAGTVYDIGDLGLGINTTTAYYDYTVSDIADGVTNHSEALPNGATASSLKAYIGGTVVAQQANTGDATTVAILCEGEDPVIAGGLTGLEDIVYAGVGVGNAPSCPAGSEILN